MSLENNNLTCFNEHKKRNMSCEIKDCRYWHDLSGKNNNCFIQLFNIKIIKNINCKNKKNILKLI